VSVPTDDRELQARIRTSLEPACTDRDAMWDAVHAIKDLFDEIEGGVHEDLHTELATAREELAKANECDRSYMAWDPASETYCSAADVMKELIQLREMYVDTASRAAQHRAKILELRKEVIRNGERATAEFGRAESSFAELAGVNDAYIDVNQRRESAERERDAAMAARDKARAQVRILALYAEGQLGYLRPSDEWMNLGEPLNDDLQDAAHELVAEGLLSEFTNDAQPGTHANIAASLPEEAQN
jgi:hypothetical protein